MLNLTHDVLVWIKDAVVVLGDNDDELSKTWILQAEHMIAEFERVADELTEAVVDNSVTLQDPVLAALLANVSSSSRAIVDLLLANLIVEDEDDPGTFVVAEPAINEGEIQPDPNDPGFFV